MWSQKVAGSIPNFFSLHIEVSLCKAQNLHCVLLLYVALDKTANVCDVKKEGRCIHVFIERFQVMLKGLGFIDAPHRNN